MECREEIESFLNDFAVDDLLNLSDAVDVFDSSSSLSSSQREKDDFGLENDQNTLVSPVEDLLSLPVDDLEELEWLSNFVDDSYTSDEFPVNRSSKEVSVEVETRYIPVKPRSKRRRINGRIWSPLGVSTAEEKIKKRGRKKREVSEHQRRCCSHCGVQKTPQWRMGPLGAKTLCNACGVRFKSGRLLPEYRPACSPTFSTKIHSNSHRKVLELRLMKTVESSLV